MLRPLNFAPLRRGFLFMGKSGMYANPRFSVQAGACTEITGFPYTQAGRTLQPFPIAGLFEWSPAAPATNQAVCACFLSNSQKTIAWVTNRAGTTMAGMK